jgi:predicted NBD/HSP70 family sugar kinase
MNATVLQRTGPPERDSSRARLLRQLRRHGSMARVELGRRMGLSAAAVSTITSELIGNGVFVESVDEPTAEIVRGRPPVNLQFNADYARVAAASLRMDVVDAVVADFAGRILVREQFPCSTRSLTGDEVIAQCTLAIETVLSRVPGPPPSAIGLAVQGIIDPTVGRQVWSPILSIGDADFVSPLIDHFGVPIVMENDAAATAMAAAQLLPELRQGLVGVLMVGHGVGMGLLVDGGPFPGTRGASSEIGHVRRQPAGAQCRCGQRGCIEAYLADYALYRDARTIANLSMTSQQQPSEQQMTELVKRAEEGEPHVVSLFREAGVALSDAVRVLASVLLPDRIAIAGSALRAFHLMRPTFEQGLQEFRIPAMEPAKDVVIVPGGTELIVAGMVHLALERVDMSIAADASVQAAS